MLERYWVIVIAFGLALPIYAQERVAVGGPAVTDEQAAQEDGTSADQSEQPAFPVVILETREQASHATEREAKTDQHEADDLAAQRKAADAADRAATAADRQILPIWVQVSLAGVGTFLLVWTLYLNSRASRDASIAALASIRAADAAEKAYLMENRPWIKITPTMIGPVDFGKREVEADFRIDNVGKSPAVNVRIMLDARVVRVIQPEKRHIAEIAEAHSKNAKYNTLMSALVFPGDPLETRAQGRIEELAALNGKPTTEVDLALICTATYRSNLGETFFHTSMTYMVKEGKAFLRTDRQYETDTSVLNWRADPRLTSAS